MVLIEYLMSSEGIVSLDNLESTKTYKRKTLISVEDYEKLQKASSMPFEDFTMFEAIPSIFTKKEQVETYIQYELGFDLERVKQIAI